jgi:hypothetical protein
MRRRDCEERGAGHGRQAATRRREDPRRAATKEIPSFGRVIDPRLAVSPRGSTRHAANVQMIAAEPKNRKMAAKKRKSHKTRKFPGALVHRSC